MSQDTLSGTTLHDLAGLGNEVEDGLQARMIQQDIEGRFCP
jgi:hypothetical protein